MTMLHISEAELVPISTAEFRALRQRLFEHDIVKARAEVLARIEAAEIARAAALAEAERLHLEAQAAAARQRTVELVAQFHVVPVRGDFTTSAKAILKEVSEKHNFSVAVITGGRRHRAVILARHEAMYRITVECPHMSYSAIGQRFGGRDHTTVRYGAIMHAERNGLPLPDRAGMPRS